MLSELKTIRRHKLTKKTGKMTGVICTCGLHFQNSYLSGDWAQVSPFELQVAEATW